MGSEGENVSPALSRGERAKSGQGKYSRPKSNQCQPLTHHPTPSPPPPCYVALLIKEASEDVCFSSPRERKCNGHLPQASDPLGSSRFHHSGLLVISREVG